MIARVKLDRILLPVLLAAMLTPLLSGSVLAVGYHNSTTTPQSAYEDFIAGFDAADSVGGLFLDSNTAPDTFASGVLIHPNFVLFAGHSALSNDNDESSFYDDYFFVLGPNTSAADATEFQYADEVILHPAYNGPESGVDLALLYFETPFTSTAPAEFYQEDVQVGDVATIVGFGRTGTPATGIQTVDGIKRAAQNVVDAVDSIDFGYFGHRFRDTVHPNFLPLGGQALPSDSGGGWFIESDDDFFLAGITSGGGQEPGYGIDSSAYELRRAATWINETIASKQIPEPSTLLLASLTGMLICPRRRRV